MRVNKSLTFINPLMAFHCFRSFVLMTNSIIMCPNAVLLWEHHYDMYVTNILSFWLHGVLLFLIVYSVITRPIRVCLIMHFGYAFLAIFPVWCNDNKQQKYSCFSMAIYWIFLINFWSSSNFSMLNNIIKIDTDNMKHCLQWVWNQLLPISF